MIQLINLHVCQCRRSLDRKRGGWWFGHYCGHYWCWWLEGLWVGTPEREALEALNRPSHTFGASIGGIGGIWVGLRGLRDSNGLHGLSWALWGGWHLLACNWFLFIILFPSFMHLPFLPHLPLFHSFTASCILCLASSTCPPITYSSFTSSSLFTCSSHSSHSLIGLFFIRFS